MSLSNRRSVLARAAAAGTALWLAGCDRLAAKPGFARWLASSDRLTEGTQRALTSRNSLAHEYSEADIAPSFRANGTLNPQSPEYVALRANNFRDWRLGIGGLVKNPFSLSLEELRALPARTQITRHDCVEGWSAIGKWKGPLLGPLLDRAGVEPAARFVVFRCLDNLGGVGMYYESIALEDAYHPQTILAYDLNDKPLPVGNGAPLRVRLERMLGYKMAKYLVRIELVDSLAGIEGGKGGYWEDRGYQWFGGI